MAELDKLNIIAFSHRKFELSEVGKLVIDERNQEDKLTELKLRFKLEEVMLIATCNRVELVFVASFSPNVELVAKMLQTLFEQLKEVTINNFAKRSQIFSGQAAFDHLIRVSCSLDSMVVGEKEILAQVRQAYDRSRKMKLTGDFLRLIMNRVVKTAKEVYTHTRIADRPVSVVSIAYRMIRSLKVPGDARMLIIGAGQTNKLFSKYLKKHGSNNFAVFNRTLSKAEELAAELGGTAYALSALNEYTSGFDVIITCTGATETIIGADLYQCLLAGEQGRKIILDLAVPHDTDEQVQKLDNVHFIGMEQLQTVANENRNERYSELQAAEQIIHQNIEGFAPILRQRKIELAMKQVPHKIKEIRQTAVAGIFAEDIQQLDPNSRDVLEKVLNYMEKRYVSEPMVMAKEIFLNAGK